MTYESSDKHLKISVRMFLDDLEMALQKHSGDIKLDISRYEIDSPIDSELEKYLLDHFKITIDKKARDYVYLGGEIEVDALWCYIEIEKLKSFKSISVENTIFFEVFDDQENLVHLRKDGKVKSMRLTEEKSRNTLIWD